MTTATHLGVTTGTATNPLQQQQQQQEAAAIVTAATSKDNIHRRAALTTIALTQKYTHTLTQTLFGSWRTVI
jgi:hypothetical protein